VASERKTEFGYFACEKVEERKGCTGKDLQRRKVLSLE